MSLNKKVGNEYWFYVMFDVDFCSYRDIRVEYHMDQSGSKVMSKDDYEILELTNSAEDFLKEK